MFLLLVVPKRGVGLELPSRVTIDRSEECGQEIVDLQIDCGEWKIPASEGREVPRSFSCSPKGYGERDWTVTITLPPTKSRACAYDLSIVDSSPNDITLHSPQYPDVERSLENGATTYRLHGTPWSTYAVVPIWHSGEKTGFAGELILIGFYQQQGANVRGAAILGFIAYLVVAAALMTVLLLHRFRALQRIHADSWISVALLSAAGGAIAGALFMLRPPDVGGYKEPADILSALVFVMLMSCAIGVAGVFFAWARRQLCRRSRPRRILVISLVLLFVISLTTILTAKWSAYSRPEMLGTWTRLRNAYYIYFASSVSLPLVLCQDTGVHSDEAAEVRDRFLRLLGIAAFCGFLAFLMGLVTSDYLQVANPGQIYRGFYKPGGGVVLWILSLFIIASPCAAFSASARPGQIQPLDEDLLRAAGDAELRPAREASVSRRAIKKQTILFLAANPAGTDRLALDREARTIDRELERSGYRDNFEFVTRWVAEPLDLIRQLRKLKPAVVHFSGHGENIGDRVVSTMALAETFCAAGSSVRLVVLNACYSEPWAAALLNHVDCVVGLPSSVCDDAARSFACGFYGGLGDGESVETAFGQGCAAIALEGLSDADRPQLRGRGSANAARLVLAADSLPARRGRS